MDVFYFEVFFVQTGKSIFLKRVRILKEQVKAVATGEFRSSVIVEANKYSVMRLK
jgi:hypothetical protein